MNTLITKDAKGKIRVAEFDKILLDDGSYLITRVTYQYGGKRTQQPDIIISEGKAKRTVSEQAELKFNSLIKEKLDKGYKKIDNSIDTYTSEELNTYMLDFDSENLLMFKDLPTIADVILKILD